MMNASQVPSQVARLLGSRIELIFAVASGRHESWRAARRLADGTYEPRPHPTMDRTWIAIHGTATVDIASTSFFDLPTDWRRDNLMAAENAVDVVLSARTLPAVDDDQFIELGAGVVHGMFLIRRGWDAVQPEQRGPYEFLSEELKDYDREVVRRALEETHRLLAEAES